MPIISCFPAKVENDDRYLQLTGGTMQGNINMGGSKVTGLGAPSDATDAVRQQDLAALSDEIDKVIAGTTPITMPAATEVKAGVVKIGEGLSVTADGIIAVESDASPTQGSTAAAQSGGVYTALAAKQDKLSGVHGQLVGFDSSGNAIAQAAPDTGVITFNDRTGAVTPQDGDYTADMVGARADTWLPSPAEIGAVPTTRKINGQALSGDVTLDAEDVGARPASWTPAASDVGAIPTTEKGAASGVATLGTDGKVPASQLPQMDYIPTSMKGANSGVAELDETGKVPASQLPSYVDDVVEYANRSAFPGTGEAGKIYVTQDTNLTYRWSGSEYVEISPSLALGETSSTAYRGDRGAAAYNHSQITSGNPHGTTAADVGARPSTWTPTADEVGARPNTWTPSAADVGAVPVGRTVNGHALSDNISLTAADVGARASNWTPSASDVGAVPTDRTVNGKALSQNITLSAGDVGALASSTTLAQLPDDTSHRTVTDTEKNTWNAKASTPVYRSVTLTTGGWSDNSQTVSVSGVLADEASQLIQPMPAIASQSAYISAGIICSGQAANQLTFTCSTVPTENISLYVVITAVTA